MYGLIPGGNKGKGRRSAVHMLPYPSGSPMLQTYTKKNAMYEVMLDAIDINEKGITLYATTSGALLTPSTIPPHCIIEICEIGRDGGDVRNHVFSRLEASGRPPILSMTNTPIPLEEWEGMLWFTCPRCLQFQRHGTLYCFSMGCDARFRYLAPQDHFRRLILL